MAICASKKSLDIVATTFVYLESLFLISWQPLRLWRSPMTARASGSVHFARILATFIALLALGGQSQAAIEKASERVSPFYGSLSRAVPIEVPPFHGLEPKLAFSYSSEGRNGFLGVGWSLTGISTIERVNAGLGTPRWDDATDTYILDGQPLVPCGPGIVSPSCSSGGTHVTKDDSYLKIVHHADNTWTVYGRDGTRTIFSPTLQFSPEQTLRWGQTSTIDTKGNTVTTTWTVLDSETYPDAISYNGYSISFGREARTDTLSFAAGEILGKTLYRLRTVFVWLGQVGSVPIRAYRLLYSYSPLTGRSLVTSIEQFGKDVNQGGVPLPAQTFTYQDDLIGKEFHPISGDPPTPPATLENVVWTNFVKTAASGSGNSLTRITPPSEWDAGAASTRALASGNGYVEVLTTLGADSVFGLSNGDGGDETPWDIDFAIYQSNQPPVPTLYVWEDGEQKAVGNALVAGQPLRIEIQGNQVIYKQNGNVVWQHQTHLRYPLLVDASIHNTNGVISNAVLYGSLRYISHWCGGVLLTADVNGDGRTDQVCHKGGEGTLQVALATSAGFDAATTWASGLTSNKLTMGDFNSDGKSDVAFYEPNADFFVSLSDGTEFATPPSLWGNANGIDPNPPHYAHACQGGGGFPAIIGTGDFDGDGITDVWCRVAAFPQAFVGLSNGSSAFSFSIFGSGTCDYPYETTGAIDFDGDGKDDWYCAGLTNSVLHVFPSTGSSFVFPAFGSLDNTFCSGGYVLGDFNGDGRTDAACGNSSGVALSTGRHFVVQPPPPGPPTALCAGGIGAFAADVDGDGASEVVCNNPEDPPNDAQRAA
jgi:hypothetical protein